MVIAAPSLGLTDFSVNVPENRSYRRPLFNVSQRVALYESSTKKDTTFAESFSSCSTLMGLLTVLSVRPKKRIIVFPERIRAKTHTVFSTSDGKIHIPADVIRGAIVRSHDRIVLSANVLTAIEMIVG